MLPFLYLYAVSDTLLLHKGNSALGAAQGELPEGQERVPWGDNSAAQFVSVLLQTAPADLIFEIYIISVEHPALR